MRCLSLLVLAGLAPLNAADRIGDIEFFGCKGIDVAAVRAALPVHSGDEYTQGVTTRQVREAVIAAIGKAPTDLAFVCCDENGRSRLFIGLPGASYKASVYDPTRKGSERLSPEIITLYKRVDLAIQAATRKGGEAAMEDDSSGYALGHDPEERSLQLEMRTWALKHQPELLRVLALSSDPEQRRVASEVLGYAEQSKEQIRALVRAANDSDSDVRNNSTRALSVLAQSHSKFMGEISAEPFIAMLHSGTWTDRNKSAALLFPLTEARDPALLSQLRQKALDPLIEMASWRSAGHAISAQFILGRIAGIPDIILVDQKASETIDAVLRTR